ncbi:MAG: hypothetical protein HLUCCA12_02165 [Rhodobacteraceae bacterium HLUCCA12]|nr:MAG: hypothetical protein HLUCCA12_02165 [Rhodobacteraceae bacterium HLUCCA12]
MAYEYDPITGRNMADREAERHPGIRAGAGSTPWLILAGAVVAILALLFAFGGPTEEGTSGGDSMPATGEEVAPGSDGESQSAPAD